MRQRERGRPQAERGTAQPMETFEEEENVSGLAGLQGVQMDTAVALSAKRKIGRVDYTFHGPPIKKKHMSNADRAAALQLREEQHEAEMADIQRINREMAPQRQAEREAQDAEDARRRLQADAHMTTAEETEKAIKRDLRATGVERRLAGKTSADLEAHRAGREDDPKWKEKYTY